MFSRIWIENCYTVLGFSRIWWIA